MRLAAVCLLLLSSACSRRDDTAAARESQQQNPAAFKAGKAAHEIARESGRLAEKAGRKLADEAHAAQEGWKEQSRADRARQK